MKHYCPMCGEQWNEDVCDVCDWREGKQPRYTPPRTRRRGVDGGPPEMPEAQKPANSQNEPDEIATSFVRATAPEPAA